MDEPPVLERSIVLTGFMGVGKSTVGTLLARRLGVSFVDLDRRIEEETGLTVSELFRTSGEAHFRVLERDCLRRVLTGNPSVIAAGGGTLCSVEGLELACGAADVIWLRAGFEALWRRISRNPSRPLVAEGEAEVHRRFREREAYYRHAHLRIETDGLSPDRVVELVARSHQQWRTPVEPDALLARGPSEWNAATLTVALPQNGYPLSFRRGGLSGFGSALRRRFLRAARAVVITNERVGGLYYGSLSAGLRSEGFELLRLDVPDGEHAKSLAEVGRLLDALIEARLERREPLVALGGGVVGDLTGFVASIYLRGVPFVQVPTTLLAQVDSSVGGKTGVNSSLGKNLIGSFYQPAQVLMDVNTLRTLADDEFRSGLAEVIKYAAIRDRVLWDMLELEQSAILGRDERVLESIVCRCCANKAQVVIRDEREDGERASLNFGHTLGHAIEAVAGYGTVKHGLAVGIGMAFAARLSARLELCSWETVQKLESLLNGYGIPVRMPVSDVDACLDAMRRDKKVSSGSVRYVLLQALGQSCFATVDFEQLRAELIRFVGLNARPAEG